MDTGTNHALCQEQIKLLKAHIKVMETMLRQAPYGEPDRFAVNYVLENLQESRRRVGLDD